MVLRAGHVGNDAVCGGGSGAEGKMRGWDGWRRKRRRMVGGVGAGGGLYVRGALAAGIRYPPPHATSSGFVRCTIPRPNRWW